MVQRRINKCIRSLLTGVSQMLEAAFQTEQQSASHLLPPSLSYPGLVHKMRQEWTEQSCSWEDLSGEKQSVCLQTLPFFKSFSFSNAEVWRHAGNSFLSSDKSGPLPSYLLARKPSSQTSVLGKNRWPPWKLLSTEWLKKQKKRCNKIYIQQKWELF